MDPLVPRPATTGCDCADVSQEDPADPVNPNVSYWCVVVWSTPLIPLIMIDS